MKIIPFSEQQFSFLKEESVQTAKYIFGYAIKQELFLWRFVSKSENAIYYESFFNDAPDPYVRFSQSMGA